MKQYLLFAALVLAGTMVVLAQDKTKAVTDPAPDATLEVTQCGELVVMWIFYEGHIIRADPNHHPDSREEYNAFLTWAQKDKARVDAVILPCPDRAK